MLLLATALGIGGAIVVISRTYSIWLKHKSKEQALLFKQTKDIYRSMSLKGNLTEDEIRKHTKNCVRRQSGKKISDHVIDYYLIECDLSK